MNDIYIAILVVVLLFTFIILFVSRFGFKFESPEERAGRRGESFVAEIIREILKDDDILLTNVSVKVEGKQAELDNVVINDKGIFIIEVKNFKGELIGDEDSYEWIQTKISGGGNLHNKTVKNPIKQVKRQIYILSGYLKQYGIDIWIEGYVFFVEMNSPIESPLVLETQRDIDRAINGEGREKISQKLKTDIVELLT